MYQDGDHLEDGEEELDSVCDILEVPTGHRIRPKQKAKIKYGSCNRKGHNSQTRKIDIEVYS